MEKGFENVWEPCVYVHDITKVSFVFGGAWT